MPLEIDRGHNHGVLNSDYANVCDRTIKKMHVIEA